MGGVFSTDQVPGGTSAGTVEQSATSIRSYSLSTDTTQPEVHRTAVKISDFPPALAPISQIRTCGGILFPPSGQLHEGRV